MKTTRERCAVSWFNRKKRLINFSPTYQREGGVWSKDKKQLFIDSVVNGYDIPKIYMHSLDQDDDGYEYAVVDGKQRISTLLEFLEGEIEFGEDFKYTGPDCDTPPKAGDRFIDLPEATREVIKENSLDVVVIDTKDEDDIEELFSRLNNGEKLNAAESRNAFGGKMAGLVRDLIKEPFFTTKMGFPNRRYAHYEVSCKLLYIEHNIQKGSHYVDLKKKHLDAFVRDYKGVKDPDATKLMDAVKSHLHAMEPVFDRADIELSKQSYPQLMYIFCRLILDRYGASDLASKIKQFLTEFRMERLDNLNRDEDRREAELSEYGRLMQQGTNDSSSMEARVEILTKRFLRAFPEVQLKDPKRAFTMEERWALWQRAGKKCENCRRDLETLDELDGDHIVWHVQGGPTSLSNARALCVACNRGKLAQVDP